MDALVAVGYYATAVLGYGMAAIALLAFVHSFVQFARTKNGSPEEDRWGWNWVGSLVVAFIITLLTTLCLAGIGSIAA